MQTAPTLALAATAALALAPASRAAVLAGFDFTGADPALQIANGTRIAPSTVAPGAAVTNNFGGGTFSPVGTAVRRKLQVASVDVVPGTVAVVDTLAADDANLRDNLVSFGVFEQSQNDAGAATGGLNSLQGAINEGSAFLSFTVAPSAGQTLDLDNLAFDYFTGFNQATGVGVFTSVGGFAAASDAVLNYTATRGDAFVGTTAPADGFFTGFATGITADLSGSQFDAIAAPLEVRLYFYGAQFNMNGNNGRRFNALDNVILNGSVASATPIPEPTSVALLGAGGLLVLRRRRRLA